MEDINLLLNICMFLCGVGLVGAGAYIIQRGRKLRQYGLVREAVVVRFDPQSSRTTAPVLEYMTASGLHQVKSRFSGNRFFFPFNQGDTVRIFYDQANFKRFYIEGDRVPAFLAALMIALGIITLQVMAAMNLVVF